MRIENDHTRCNASKAAIELRNADRHNLGMISIISLYTWSNYKTVSNNTYSHRRLIAWNRLHCDKRITYLFLVFPTENPKEDAGHKARMHVRSGMMWATAVCATHCRSMDLYLGCSSSPTQNALLVCICCWRLFLSPKQYNGCILGLGLIMGRLLEIV